MSEDTDGDRIVSLLEKNGVTFSDAIDIPTAQIRRMDGQPREEFDEEELANLQATVRFAGQLQDAVVRPLTEEELAARSEDESEVLYELVDGERRYRTCMALKLDLSAKVAHGLTRELQYLISVALNLNRSEHTALEKFNIVRQLQENGYTAETISATTGFSIPTVSNYTRLQGLRPELIALLGAPTPKEKRMGVSIGLLLTNVHPDRQMDAYALLADNPTVQKAKAIIGRFLAEDAAAAHPERKARRVDAHSTYIMIARFIERGETLVDSVTYQAVGGIKPAKKQELHSALDNLFTNIVSLQDALQVESAEKPSA